MTELRELFDLREGDVRDVLRTMPDESVDCVVTSPPYWGLRDYGHADQMGQETTPELYIDGMVALFREVRRILKPDGTCWVNLGDSYSASGVKNASGLPAKNLVGIPWRFALAAQADGWILRQDIIWHKPNPMPESVTDRCTKGHEYVFLLTKSERYWWDGEAMQEDATHAGQIKKPVPNGKQSQMSVANRQTRQGFITKGLIVRNTRNRRTVWIVPTQPFADAHFATFPPDLIRPMIRAGCRPDGVVLDPFLGSGTTALVALEEGRRAIGIELNPEYAEMARRRCAPMLNQIRLPLDSARD